MLKPTFLSLSLYASIPIVSPVEIVVTTSWPNSYDKVALCEFFWHSLALGHKQIFLRRVKGLSNRHNKFYLVVGWLNGGTQTKIILRPYFMLYLLDYEVKSSQFQGIAEAKPERLSSPVMLSALSLRTMRYLLIQTEIRIIWIFH